MPNFWNKVFCDGKEALNMLRRDWNVIWIVHPPRSRPQDACLSQWNQDIPVRWRRENVKNHVAQPLS
jgi:hypothetical protein